MFYALTSSASALVNVVSNDLVTKYVASICEGICSKAEDQPGIPRRRTRNPSFVSPLREQEKYNSPFNHPRENRVSHADHNIHVNSHDVLVLSWSVVSTKYVGIAWDLPTLLTTNASGEH